MKNRDSFKLGIILNSQVIPLWIFRVIEKIIDFEFVEVKLLVYNHDTSVNYLVNSFFYRLYEKIEKFIFHNRVDFYHTVRLSEILERVTESTIHSTFTDICQAIYKSRFDLILNFSTFAVNDPHIKLASFGIWNYTVEDQNPLKGNSNVYWKTIHKSPVIKVSLQSSNDGSGRMSVIHSSWLPTNFNSILLNLNEALEMASQVIPRLIKGLLQYGVKFLNNQALKYINSEVDSLDRFQLPPSNIQVFININVVLFRYLYNRLINNKKSKWFLMYKRQHLPFPKLKNNYQVLIPPNDRFWADPFVICKNNKVFIFIEEFLYHIGKGHITLLELDKTGNLINKELIMEKSYHMSYPFVFEHDDGYYMVPETSENRTVELYKSEGFPQKWRFVINLMENINAKDSTIFYYHNKWWMFSAINESPNYSNHVELFLYYSNDLISTQWISHPCNPIVTDIRNARPAGKVFIHDNKIYRPSQDCSVRYGRAINMNQIVTLSETSYKEIFISKTEATWNADLKGTHTSNFDEDFSIIDVYKY